MATATATKPATGAARNAPPRGPAKGAAAQRASTEMNVFAWKGKDKRGKVMTGEQIARNANLVKAELRRQGINVIDVQEKKKKTSAGRSISSQEVTMFSRQLATMMQAGVPLVQGFDIIAGGQKNPRMQNMLIDIKNSIEGGSTLTEGLARHPAQFDELFINLVRAGEQAGVLDTILDTIATYKENFEALKGKVKKALYYPAAVLAVALIVSLILLIYVVPQFESLFASFGGELPAFTQAIVNASRFFQSWGGALTILGFIGAIVLFLQMKKRSRAFSRWVDLAMLKIPVLGQIMHQSSLARFARTLATTFRAGVPLVEALDTVAGATGNVLYQEATLRIKEDVAVGHQLQLAMRQSGVFPHMMVQMTAIGEESGALDTMLTKVAEFYEQEVNNAVDALSSLLEPFIIVLLGVIVGSMVVGMYLPVFKMATVM